MHFLSIYPLIRHQHYIPTYVFLVLVLTDKPLFLSLALSIVAENVVSLLVSLRVYDHVPSRRTKQLHHMNLNSELIPPAHMPVETPFVDIVFVNHDDHAHRGVGREMKACDVEKRSIAAPLDGPLNEL